jgi:hypothetical protein
MLQRRRVPIFVKHALIPPPVFFLTMELHRDISLLDKRSLGRYIFPLLFRITFFEKRSKENPI